MIVALPDLTTGPDRQSNSVSFKGRRLCSRRVAFKASAHCRSAERFHLRTNVVLFSLPTLLSTSIFPLLKAVFSALTASPTLLNHPIIQLIFLLTLGPERLRQNFRGRARKGGRNPARAVGSVGSDGH